nr:uncharacterized protein LOC122268845 isoform X2 [Parasteatoda tepidariorum]
MNLLLIISSFVAGIIFIFIGIGFMYNPIDVNWVSYIRTRLWIRSYLRKYKKKIVYPVKKEDVTPYDVGLIPYPFEYEMENPQTKNFEVSFFISISNPLKWLHY